MFDPTIDARFEGVKQLFDDQAEHPDLDRPIAKWVHANDSHLPQKFLSDTLRQLLSPTRWQEVCAAPGVGMGRLSKLLDLLERAGRSLKPTPAPPAAEESEVREWEVWGAMFRLHQMDGEPLGRIARSLLEIPFSLWDVSLGTYTNRRLADIQMLGGHGPARVRQILQVIRELARAVPVESPEHLRCRLTSRPLHRVAIWIHGVLGSQTVPDLDSFRASFIEPLLEQFAIDLGADESDLIRRRWGVEAPSLTLEELGQELGLTRERIRQITAGAADVVRVRWPEGRHLLDDFYEFLLQAPDAAALVALCRTTMESCYGVAVARGGSRNEVLDAWDRAGRNKLTPMTGDQLDGWLAASFPQHSPETARAWLADTGLVHRPESGELLYFSRDPLDVILLAAIRRAEPFALEEAAEALGTEARAALGRIDRDPRFVVDEEKRIHSGERLGILRRDGVWCLRLEPSESARADAISISNLAHLVVGGMLDNGIADASVWGVHRFAQEQLHRAYGSVLFATLTPIVLADVLDRMTGGLIATMRRRRLRWDTADGSVPVRNKRGWVEYVVVCGGVPITLEELRDGLHKTYQDYEDYVTNQLTFEEEDGGAVDLAFHTTAGLSTRIPKLFIPKDWVLNESHTNISEGTRVFVERIMAASGERDYDRNELAHLPWVVEICSRRGINWPA